MAGEIHTIVVNCFQICIFVSDNTTVVGRELLGQLL